MARSLLPPLALLALAACMAPSAGVKRDVNALLASQDFLAAAERLKGVKESQYGKRNAVLYNLDLGLLLHHAGKFAESDAHLDKAETRMEELYTKSVSQAAGTILINDLTVEYAGRPHERALLHAVRALNWLHQERLEEALVEARKAEVFLDGLKSRRDRRQGYKDDAFVRALDSLLYADAGKEDDARISREAAVEAYGWYAADYGTRAPDLGGAMDAATGEVVFLHYNGVAPRAVSTTLQIAWREAAVAVRAVKADTADKETAQKVDNALTAGIAAKSVTISLPEMTQDPYRVAGSEVSADDARAGTVLVEDVAAIVTRDLKDRLPGIRVRAAARAATKYLLAELAEREVKNRAGGGKLEGWLAHAAVSLVTAGTEEADTRGWSTLPAQIRMARLRLPPGAHRIAVRFTDASGAVVATHEFPSVQVRAGRRVYLHHRTAQ